MLKSFWKLASFFFFLLKSGSLTEECIQCPLWKTANDGEKISLYIYIQYITFVWIFSYRISSCEGFSQAYTHVPSMSVWNKIKIKQHPLFSDANSPKLHWNVSRKGERQACSKRPKKLLVMLRHVLLRIVNSENVRRVTNQISFFLRISDNYGMNASWICTQGKNLDFGLLYLSHIWVALPHIALRASAFISHIAHVLLHWKPQLIMFLFHALSFTSFLSAICSSHRPLCCFLVLPCRPASMAFIRRCMSGWRRSTEADTHISTFEQACHLWSMMSRSGASGYHVLVPSVP